MKTLYLNFHILLFLLILSFHIQTAIGQNNTSSYTNKADLKFQQLTIDDGLCSNTVNDILEDSRGYIWIATNYGLARYDGVDFTCYQHNKNNNISLPQNEVVNMLEYKPDDNNSAVDTKIWILTHNKMCYYSYSNNEFKTIEGIPSPKFDKEKRYLELDKEGRIWVSDPLGYYDSKEEKFLLLDRDTSKNKISAIYNFEDSIYIHKYNVDNISSYDRIVKKYPSENEKEISNLLNIGSFHTNNYAVIGDSIWIPNNPSAKNELTIFNTKKQDFETPNIIPKDYLQAPVLSLYYSKPENVLWIGDLGGLVRLDLNNSTPNKIRRFSSNILKPYTTLTKNQVSKIFVDKRNRLWVGLIDGGVCMYSPKVLFEDNSKGQKLDTTAIPSNTTSDLLYDSKNRLWIATNNVLSMFDSLNNRYRNFIPPKDTIFNSSRNWIKSIALNNSKNKIIIAYWGGIPNIFNIKEQTWQEFEFSNFQNIKTKITNNKNYLDKYLFINDVFVDKEERVWFASSGTGVLCYSFKSKNFSHYILQDKPDFNFNKMGIIYVTSNNLLLTGSLCGNGLFLLNLDNKPQIIDLFSEDTTKYNNDSTEINIVQLLDNQISNNYVQSIYEDSNRDIWVGTRNGLNKVTYSLDSNNKIIAKDIKVKKFDATKTNLLHPNITSIIEDDKENLWLGSIHGLYEFSLDKERIISNYTYENGLQSNEFLPNSSTKNTKGDIAFGGIKGFNVFNPDDQKFRINSGNTNFKDNNPVILLVDQQEYYSDHKDILEFDQDPNRTFLFKINPNIKNQLDPKKTFQHQLINHDDKPIKNDIYNYSYTNLLPGKYTFELKGYANDFIEDIGNPITFRILSYRQTDKFIYSRLLPLIAILSLGSFYLFLLFRYKSFSRINKYRIKDIVYIELKEDNDSIKKFWFFYKGKKNVGRRSIFKEFSLLKDKLQRNKFIKIDENYWVNPSFILKWSENTQRNSLTIFYKEKALMNNFEVNEVKIGYYDDFIESMMKFLEENSLKY